MHDIQYQARLTWLCRRGMKELDLILNTYLKEKYPSAEAVQRYAFECLLQMPDPVLYDLILGRVQHPDLQINHVLQNLCDTTKT